MSTRFMFILSLIFFLGAVLYAPNLTRTGEIVFAQQCCPCPVQPLAPITDQTAQAFENGQTIDTAHLTQDMQNSLNCFMNAINNNGGHFHLNSAYRPPQYQSHLREVWDKHLALQRVRGAQRRANCAALAQTINQEFARHTLLPTQRPAGPNGPHTQGLAIDVPINNLGFPLQTVLAVASNCNLYRPHLPADPVHFEHQ